MTRDEIRNLQEQVKNGRVSRRDFIKIATAAGISIGAIETLLAGCAPTPTPSPVATTAAQPTEPAPTATTVPTPEKTRVVCGWGGETASLDRNYEENSLGFSIYPALFEYLVDADPNSGEILPSLATAWEQLDELTLQITLREGVKFHNGEEFDAQAVYDTAMEILTVEPPATMYGRIRLVDEVEIVDKYTVRFHTEEPFVMLLPGLSQMAIYPSEYYKEVGQAGFAQAPIGTGPWKFKEWERGVHITLEKFDDYWGGPEVAQIDELVWKFYPESATRLAALETGEIDVASNVPPDDIERLKSKGLEIAWTPIGQGMIVQLIPRLDERLEDVRVRRAFNYAVDKDLLIEEIMLGYTKKLDGQVVGSDCFGYNPNLEPFPYDPDKARELLAEAGYPDGLSIKMHGSEGRYAKQKEMCEAVAGQLTAAGIDVELEFLEWATFCRHLFKTQDTHPLGYIGWNYFPVMDGDFAMQHFMCSSAFKLYCNPEIDERFDKSRQEFDREKRRQMLQEVNAMLHEEAPAIYLFQAPDIYGVNPRVNNLKPTPDNALKFSGVYVEEA
jgi:peptide/nickel transport system substrate-binding protein